ncbi:poly(A) binding protein interacting protein 1 isoform X2 [Haemaphysalis longicornis]
MDSGHNAKGPGKSSGITPPPGGSAVTPVRQSTRAGQTATECTPERASSSLHDNDNSMASFVSKSTLSPEAPVFVPRHFKMPPTEAPNEPYPSSPPSDPNQDAIMELMSFIEDVTLSPAEFDAKIGDITGALSTITDANGLAQVVDTIFQQGVKEPNFRYSGARLCNHLSKRLHIRGVGEEEFTSILIDRCHNECAKRTEMSAGDPGDPYLRGLLLFVAELLSQMAFLREDNSYKVKNLANCIPMMMHTLLQTLTKDNVKCTTQVLKLTGSILEDLDCDAITPRRGILDSVFEKLSEIVKKEDLDATAALMIRNVLELRKKDWGRTSSHSSSPSAGPAEDSLPILCGPDGVPISREEEHFVNDLLLKEQMGNLSVSDGGSYSNDCCNDEMDEEIAAAYEEFLKESGQ